MYLLGMHFMVKCHVMMTMMINDDDDYGCNG